MFIVSSKVCSRNCAIQQANKQLKTHSYTAHLSLEIIALLFSLSKNTKRSIRPPVCSRNTSFVQFFPFFRSIANEDQFNEEEKKLRQL